jgi:hypothetical protein
MRRLLMVMESERVAMPPALRTGPFSLLPHEWLRLLAMGGDYTLYHKPWFYKSGKAREAAKLVAGGLVVLLLTGCMTTYEVVKQTPEGDVRVLVKSFREFEQPQIHYSRQGQDVTFDFGAESATTASSPVEEAFGEAIKAGAVVLRPVGDGQ